MFWGLFEAYPVAVGLFLVFLFTALSGRLSMVAFLRSSVVDFHEDLPAHAVLVTEFELPASNPRVYKWIVPKPLDQMAFDAAKLERLSNEVGEAR